MRWWAVILWLFCAGPAGANVPSAVAFGYDAVGNRLSRAATGGVLTNQTHSFDANAARCRVDFGYDGNGNFTALLRTDGAVSARYKYGPFGEPIRATGPLARLNPFRWSTKYCDEETGLVYYGYRYYSPSLGRWISKDPIGEEGGLNLYGFVGNSAMDRFDRDGRESYLSTTVAQSIAIGLSGLSGFVVGAALNCFHGDHITGCFLCGGFLTRFPKVNFGMEELLGVEGEALGFIGINRNCGWNIGAISGVGTECYHVEGTPAGEHTYSQFEGYHTGDVVLFGFTDIGRFGAGGYLNDQGQLGLYIYMKILDYAFVGGGVDLE